MSPETYTTSLSPAGTTTSRNNCLPANPIFIFAPPVDLGIGRTNTPSVTFILPNISGSGNLPLTFSSPKIFA